MKTTPNGMNPSATVHPVLLNPDHRVGSYALIVRLDVTTSLLVGRLGLHRLLSGFYVYVGSALGPGGLRARLQRHLRPKEMKRPHWHIDALTAAAEIDELWWATGTQRRECDWAFTLASIGFLTPRSFGASDCRCPGHLIYFNDPEAVSRSREILQSNWKSTIHRLTGFRL